MTAQLDELQAAYRELKDIEDLRQLKARYCHLVDSAGWDELETLWTEDAECDYGFFGTFSGMISTASQAQIPGLPPCVSAQTACSLGCAEFAFGTQAYFECACECALDACLCLQDFDGLPEDVDACVEDLESEVCYEAFPVGLVQENPVLPDTLENGVYTFLDAQSGLWFDPPFATSLEYRTSGEALFLQILGFPTGFESPFEVHVGSERIGSFEPGDFVSSSAPAGCSAKVRSR